MKNKRIKKSILQVFFTMVVMGIVLLGGCSNPLMSTTVDGASSQPDGKGAVQITVNGGSATAKTILPTDPTFTAYRLEFSGPSTVDAVEQASANFGTVYLDPGEWTITAYGIADFNGSPTDVAQGSGTVTVVAGAANTLNLNIEALQTGGDLGTFDYTVSVPEAFNGMITDYSVTYHPWGDDSSPINDAGIVAYTGSGFSYTSSADIEPGYYLSTVEVSSADYAASKMEIVHIYSNMVSSGSFAFAEDDLMPVVTLSGTLEVTRKETAQDENGWTVEAFSSSDFSAASKIGEAVSDVSSAWTMDVESQDPAADIYFRASGTADDTEFYDTPVTAASTVQLGSSDISGIALSGDVMTRVSGTLSGALVDGTTVSDYSNYSLYFYLDNGSGESVIVNTDGSYVAFIEPSASPRDVQFGLSNYDIGLRDDGVATFSVGETDLSGQDITLGDYVTLSGTLEVIIDGTQPVLTNWNYIDIEASLDSGFSYEDRLGTGEVDDSANPAPWIITVPKQASATPIYFAMQGNDGTNDYYIEDIGAFTGGDAGASGITLVADQSNVIVSGTLSGTVNGSVVTDYSSYRISLDSADTYEPLGDTQVFADGTWSVQVVSQTESKDIYMEVSNDSIGLNIESEVSQGTVSDTNVDLGTYNIGSWIILSGNLDVTLDGTHQDLSTWDWRELEAYTVADPSVFASPIGETWQINPQADPDLTTWTMAIPAQSPATDLHFFFNGSDGTNEYIGLEAGTITSVGTEEMTGQTLSVNSNMITLSGTLSLTVGGTEVSSLAADDWEIDFTTDQAGMEPVAWTSVNTDGTWSVSMPAYSTATNLYYSIYGDSYSYDRLPGDTDYELVADSNVTGVTLAVDLVEISGTLTEGTGTNTNINPNTTFSSYDTWHFGASSQEKLLGVRANPNVNGQIMENGSWSVYTDAAESGTSPLYIGFNGTESTGGMVLYEHTIDVGQSNITNDSVSFDSLQPWGCFISGTYSSGSSGVDFSNGIPLFFVDQPEISMQAIVGITTIAPDGSFSGQIYQASSAYEVWNLVGTDPDNFWISDSAYTMGDSDVTGLSFNLDNAAPAQ